MTDCWIIFLLGKNNIFSVHWSTQNSPRDIYIYALGTISLLEFDSVVIDNIDNLKYKGKQISAVELISVLIKNHKIPAVTFLEYWKRKSASLAHHWDCMGFQVRRTWRDFRIWLVLCFHFVPIYMSWLQDDEEKPRPEFAAKAPYTEKNPITGVREPYFPKSARLRRIAAGSGLIILMVNNCHICTFDTKEQSSFAQSFSVNSTKWLLWLWSVFDA